MERWLITGDHTGYVPYDFVAATLDWLVMVHKFYVPVSGDIWMVQGLKIHHGAAKGVDSYADKWAVNSAVPVSDTKADWNKYGKAAGGIRNQLMLDEFKPDRLIAFPAPKSKGTWDMVRRAGKVLPPDKIHIYKYSP